MVVHTSMLLRVVYDQLSKDPGSLANLDQDLPNFVQHSIPIFSLPKEWLWCETWCGNATKAKVRSHKGWLTLLPGACL